MFSKLFGTNKNKKNQQEQSDSDQVNHAIQAVRQQIVSLEKRKAHLEKKVTKYEEEARTHARAKDRKKALVALKLKKQLQQRVDTIENQVFNLEVQIMALDETLTNKNMLETMGHVNQALNAINVEQQLEQAEELQDTIVEAMDDQQQLSKILSTPLVDFDEDELADELAELDELNDDGLLYGAHYRNLKQPKQPLIEPQVSEKQVNADADKVADDDDEYEDEFKKLEMEINQHSAHIQKRLIQAQVATNAYNPRVLIASC
jgi:hypothetical protein